MQVIIISRLELQFTTTLLYFPVSSHSHRQDSQSQTPMFFLSIENIEIAQRDFHFPHLLLLLFRFISLYPPKSKSLFSFGFLSARYTHYTEEKVMATVATNIGIMDKAYFVGRNEILTWINATLHLHLTRIEEVSWFLSFPLL